MTNKTEETNDIKFELDLRMTNDGVMCNADKLKQMLPEKLKPYNYIVTENNYDEAKKDRANLNGLIDVLKERRKQFEEIELKDWEKAKATLMEIQKIITSASEILGDGIKNIDNQEQISKMQKVKETYLIIAQAMPINIAFEKLYIRKEYDKKTMTIKKIEEDIQMKINKIISDYEMIKLFLPENEIEVEQIKEVYAQTLDIGLAKRKADDLLALHEKVAQTQSNEATVTMPVSSKPKQNEVDVEKSKTERIVVEFIATRPFYDAMNQIIKQYQPQYKIKEREILNHDSK